MSSAQVAAKSIRDLEEEDWAVLKSLEKLISRFESIPIKAIVKESKLHADQVEFRLGRLNYMGFVMRSKHGYILNTSGLDALALSFFVRKGLISRMGGSIGMGKESDVYEVVNDSGEEAVIKFYRIGRISFRTTRKLRSYVSAENQHQWLTINIGAAQRESEGMTRAGNAGVKVPRFIARDRHAILMSEIDGLMLFRCSNEDIGDPRDLLTKILKNIRISYTVAGIINGDISEYNILYDGIDPWIIDWPQFVTVSHSNSEDLIRRDVENVLSFFEKKFGIAAALDEALRFVTGKTSRFRIS